MSLYVYSGVPGSGKSYHACRDIRDCRYPVITNMQVHGLQNVAVMDLRDIKPKLLMAYSLHYFGDHEFRENALLLCIDEAQLLFNSRTWDAEDRFDWLEFLSQHRHYGYKVVLVAQDISMIDKQFRCLCEYDCRHTAAGSISIVTRALHMIGVKLTCAKYYYYDTDVLISRDFYWITRRIYQYYDTRQDLLNNDFADIDLSPITSRLTCGDGEACVAAATPRVMRDKGVIAKLLGKGGEIAEIRSESEVEIEGGEMAV